jgi:hypothetical protein
MQDWVSPDEVFLYISDWILEFKGTLHWVLKVPSGLGLGAQIGGRYFFKDNFGLNLEFGGGNALSGGKFGITYIF